MVKRSMVLLCGVALAAATSAAPRAPQEPVRVDSDQVVLAAAKKKKKKVVRKTTTRRTHTETHSSSSTTRNDANK